MNVEREKHHLKTHIMKKYSFLPLLALLMSLSSCEIIGGIFKAGVWSGVILVVVVVGLIIFILARVLGGGKS
jgi:Ni,Fe-hydrogenase III small subunit